MFWNIFYALCESHGTTPNAVCKKLKLSNATATHWKNGTIPRGDILLNIADYFNCSVDYLLGRTNQSHVINENNYINETTRRRLISLMLASTLTLTSFGLTGCGKKKPENNSFNSTTKEDTIDGYTNLNKESWFCEVSVTDVENGMLLDGAKFELRDENNNLIESWISSSKEAHRIENIKDGLYTLTEVAAPEGYVVAGNKNTWTINPSSGWKSDCMIIDNISASKYVDKGINNILNTGKKEDIDGQYFVLKLRESYENRLNNKDFLEYYLIVIQFNMSFLVQKKTFLHQ